eukprot:TRINITY_DN2237_c0_g1_i2.p1 TRINITY_DN2237_c0_g1~~TRINITY_DN2237_c0_g1_i2.p1  ORF type:complete len:655 (+),score=190.23 TRINITY_DN2237_c0_g1_i2:88-1965(+)
MLCGDFPSPTPGDTEQGLAALRRALPDALGTARVIELLRTGTGEVRSELLLRPEFVDGIMYSIFHLENPRNDQPVVEDASTAALVVAAPQTVEERSAALSLLYHMCGSLIAFASSLLRACAATPPRQAYHLAIAHLLSRYTIPCDLLSLPPVESEENTETGADENFEEFDDESALLEVLEERYRQCRAAAGPEPTPEQKLLHLVATLVQELPPLPADVWADEGAGGTLEDSLAAVLTSLATWPQFANGDSQRQVAALLPNVVFLLRDRMLDQPDAVERLLDRVMASLTHGVAPGGGETEAETAVRGGTLASSLAVSVLLSLAGGRAGANRGRRDAESDARVRRAVIRYLPLVATHIDSVVFAPALQEAAAQSCAAPAGVTAALSEAGAACEVVRLVIAGADDDASASAADQVASAVVQSGACRSVTCAYLRLSESLQRHGCASCAAVAAAQTAVRDAFFELCARSGALRDYALRVNELWQMFATACDAGSESPLSVDLLLWALVCCPCPYAAAQYGADCARCLKAAEPVFSAICAQTTPSLLAALRVLACARRHYGSGMPLPAWATLLLTSLRERVKAEAKTEDEANVDADAKPDEAEKEKAGAVAKQALGMLKAIIGGDGAKRD